MSILPYWLYLEAEDLHADINPVTIEAYSAILIDG
jgi:hypothetical protein